MKKILFSVTALFFLYGSFASETVIQPPLKASEIFLPVGKGGKLVSLLELSRIRVKEYEKLSGGKMNFFSRLGFKISQRSLRRSINYDGSFHNKFAEKYILKTIDGNTGFHPGGFALGFLSWFLFIFGGILIAYLIRDDKRKNRVKWAWIGFVSAFVLAIILVIILGFDVGVGF